MDLPSGTEDLYVTALQTLDLNVGQRVVDELLTEQPFPPSISDIQQRARKVAPEIHARASRAKEFDEGVEWLMRYSKQYHGVELTRQEAEERVSKDFAARERVSAWAAKDPEDSDRPKLNSIEEWDRYMGFVE